MESAVATAGPAQGIVRARRGEPIDTKRMTMVMTDEETATASVAGAPARSASLGEMVSSRRPATALCSLDAWRSTQVPWLLVLFPAGSLVMVALLTLVLAWFVPAPRVSQCPEPRPDTTVEVEPPTVGDPGSEEWTSCRGPAYAR
jgi:hypothetical protein